MRSSSEVLAHVLEIIGQIYERPEKFARTAGELNGALLQIHHMWGFIVDRELQLSAVHLELIAADYGESVKPESFFDALETADVPVVHLVIRHWKNVDAKMGIAAT